MMRIAEYKNGVLRYRDATTEELSELTAPEPTPAEQRERAYDTEPCVVWDGDMLTVTQAAQQWAYYAAEGNTAKTDAITALIAAAKEKIRAEWPDGEEQMKVANHRIQDLEDAKKA